MAIRKTAKKKPSIKKPVSRSTAKPKASVSKSSITPAKVVLASLAVAGAGVGGYLLYSHFKAAKQDNALEIQQGSSPIPYTSGSAKKTSATSTWKSGTFPLVKGMSKNNDVYALQLAMIKKGGAAAAAINSSGGADGSFGNGLANALSAAGLPASITSQSMLTEIINSVSASTGSNKTSTPLSSKYRTGNFTTDIRSAESTGNIDNVIEALSQLTSVADYTKANNNGDGITFMGDFLKRTIVTKLLETFGNSDRAKIESEFLRIGLKKNANNVWSLSGLAGTGQRVITTRAVYISPKGEPNVKVIVLSDFIVGTELSRSNGNINVMTIDNKEVVVPIDAVKTF